MANPISWEVVQAFRTCLADIRRSNGYRTDAGAEVFDEPAKLLQSEAQDSCAVFLEAVNRPTDRALVNVGRDLVIVVAAKVDHTLDDRHARIHALIEDLDAALANRARQFPILGRSPEFLGLVVDPVADGVMWAGVQARYAVSVRRAR